MRDFQLSRHGYETVFHKSIRRRIPESGGGN
jgi:hypothetical protein